MNYNKILKIINLFNNNKIIIKQIQKQFNKIPKIKYKQKKIYKKLLINN